MRKTKQTKEQVLEAEKAKDDRQRSRKQGFAKMKERDRGYAFLRDLKGGKEVVMLWSQTPFMEANNCFKLVIKNNKGDDTEIVLDAAEFQSSLRWV